MIEAFKPIQPNDLKSLSDSALHERTSQCARREQQATVDLLHHLHEVNRRRLFAKQAYASLWDYVVRGLGYSEAAASDRVNAMRLIFSVPEAMKQLVEGKLSLTAAAKVQRHFQQGERSGKAEARYIPEEKTRLVLQVAGQSTREAEKVLIAERTERAMPRPEKMRLIAPALTELRLDANEELMNKIQRVKELKGDLGLAEIFSRALEAYLEAEDPIRKLKRTEQRARRKAEREGIEVEEAIQNKDGESDPGKGITRAPEFAPALEVTRSPESPAASWTQPSLNDPLSPQTPRSRYIAAPARDRTWERSQGQCEYRDPKTGARCPSRFRLEYEHKVPFGKGGSSEPCNIESLCKVHNQLRAIQAYGEAWMSRFMRP